MEQGSYEMPSLETKKAARFSIKEVLAVLAVVAIAVISIVVLIVAPRDEQATPSSTCVSAPRGTAPAVSMEFTPKSAHASDYAHDPDAPLAPCPTTPAEIFPPGSGAGIIFSDAVYTHCELQPAGPDSLCRLSYASGPNFLPKQPENPSVMIEGRAYGNCRFEGSLEVLRMHGAGRDDKVAGTLRCFLLPVN